MVGRIFEMIRHGFNFIVFMQLSDCLLFTSSCVTQRKFNLFKICSSGKMILYAEEYRILYLEISWNESIKRAADNIDAS
jgi:hypothetical protein